MLRNISNKSLRDKKGSLKTKEFGHLCQIPIGYIIVSHFSFFKF